PTVRQGHSLLFVNHDHPGYEWHTITACKVPCNRSTGIAYPLANAPAATQFDSGQLVIDPTPMGPHSTPATNTLPCHTPNNLPPGTYTYYCRVHPFMRGAFRVVRQLDAHRLPDAPTAPVHPPSSDQARARHV